MAPKVLLVEDKEAHSAFLKGSLEERGYDVLPVKNLKEAEFHTKRGFRPDAWVLDVKLDQKSDDISGLMGISLAQEASPKAARIVCSTWGDKFEKIAKQLGAHKVIQKRPDLSAAAADIDGFLVHYLAREPFEAVGGVVEFLAKWLASPFLAAFFVTVLGWKAQAGLPPELRTTGAAMLPLEIATLFALSAGVVMGPKNPVISEWPLFGRFRKIAVWVIAAIAGGILYELFRIPIAALIAGLLR
jgi:ActR/RegA family two-component response regulator